jgi:FKBP-type peptidyl-prolyl cis-trans isomerase
MYFEKPRWLHGLIAAAPLVLTPMLVLAQAPTPPADATAPIAPAASAASAAPAADESSSYSVGLNFGSQLRSSGLDQSLSLDAVARGIKDGLAGKAPAPENQEQAMKLLHAGRDAVANRNRNAASAFLAQNGVIKGVVTTASGLQYTVIKAGDSKAASPMGSDRVTVNYRGRLLDGTEFDSSEKHQQAATFGLEGVLKGWREALMLMKPGAQWRVFIPPELAYGANPPPAIPPGSMLIFDVELVKIEPAPVMSKPATKAQPATKPKLAQKPTG